jgi:hypothetical protein
MSRPTSTALASTSLALALGLAPVGCIRVDDVGKRYPISGTIAYRGQPVQRAVILFTPVNTGIGAVGRVENGVYTSVTTRDQNDGILPGWYHVSIVAVAEARPEAGRADRGEASRPGQTPQDSVERILTKSGQVVPSQYYDFMKTPVQIQVTPSTFCFDFDLQG